jgi:hypothetical protein
MKTHIESNAHPTYNGTRVDQTLPWIGLNGQKRVQHAKGPRETE